MAVRTLKNIRDNVLKWLDESGAASTDTTYGIVNNAINQAHIVRLGKRPWTFMLSQPYTITTTAGKQQYSLHPDYDKPFYFRNTTTDEDMLEIPISSLEDLGLDWNDDSDSPLRFAIWGRHPVSAQPSTAAALSLVSSSASDVTSRKLRIVGDVSGAGSASETITANGTTPVNGTVAFSHITSVAKVGTWVGSATLKDNAGNTLLTLGPDDTAKWFPQLYLFADPPTGDVIEYRFYRKPTDLTQDEDIPDIPAPYSDILIYDTLTMLAGYNSDTSGQALKIWTGFQTDLEVAMESAFLEGQTLRAMPSYIRYIPDGTD